MNKMEALDIIGICIDYVIEQGLINDVYKRSDFEVTEQTLNDISDMLYDTIISESKLKVKYNKIKKVIKGEL